MKPYLLLFGLLWCFFPYSSNAQLVSLATSASTECDPLEVEKWAERGMDYWRDRENDSAIWAFNHALNCELPDTLAYKVYRILGDSYYREQNFEFAMLTIEKAENIYDLLPQSHQKFRGNLYDSKGLIFRIWGDYEQALNSFEASLLHAKSITRRLRAYINLAQTYRYKGDYPAAQTYYEQALDSVGNSDAFWRAFILDGFAELAIESKQYAKSLEYYQETRKTFAANSSYLAQTQFNIAEVYSSMEQNTRAQSAFKKAIALGHSVMDSTRELGKIYLGQARFFEKTDQLEAALKSYQTALAQVLPNIEQADGQSFAVPDTFPAENVIMDALDGKARVFRSLAGQSPEATHYHKLALQHWQWALQSQASLRQNYQEHTSKYQLVNETRNLAEPAIDQTWWLWQETHDPQYLALGFQLAERNKASMMLELMRELDLRDFQAIPFVERQVWDSTTKALALVERELNVPRAENEIKALKSKRFALRQQVIRLEKKWAREYPEYQAVKNDLTTRSLQEIQSQLKAERAILNYSIGKEQSYVWLIRSDSIVWKALDIDEGLNDEILAFRKALELGALDLDKQSYELYQKLLGPLSPLLETTTNLIIIADQAMTLLPFEALLTEVPKTKQKSFEKAYLLRKYAVSYAFSATLWAEMNLPKAPAINPNILAVAPDFPYSEAILAMAQEPDYNPTRSCLNPIQNLAEIDSLAQLSDIITLVGKQATRKQLLAQLEEYAIVHIATHAMADDEDPRKTFLVLREEGSELSLCGETFPDMTALYMNELLHNRIAAEMVVLAACQTGIGKYHHGEGLASLARSFALAGANSVVASLWSVDDRSTRDMMPRFYHYLQEGHSKDVALQKAKIDILEGGLGAPIYWASFIVMGDASPVVIPDKNHKWWWALLLLFPLLAIGVRRSRDKSRGNHK